MRVQEHSVDDEMHELNQEADYLEQKAPAPAQAPAQLNGAPTKANGHGGDSDAQAMVIESLRSQVQDLFSQVSQLNSKLVRSYDRVSELEDDLHVTSSNLRDSSLKVSQLELERTQHISALNTGLLVEKSHVTAELTRLMEKATEEAARRGQAESAREEIEKDLDDLSAGLFSQANSMVVEARLARARSERKVEETERALKGAEEIMGVLQAQMQALEAEKEQADRRVEEMRATMGKGKWVHREPGSNQSTRLRLFCMHSPYQEFVLFIGHLRSIRPASQHPPAMTTLLPLPFLARLVTEDSDPTVRLDLAPSLNWLTRRSVLSAIHSGQLTVEPMATQTLLEELAPATIPASTHNTHVACALCGAIIIDAPPSSAKSPSSLMPPLSRSGSQANSWSQSFLKGSLVQTISTAAPSMLSSYSQNHSSSSPPSEPPSQVYIFRLATTSSSGLPVSLPLTQQQGGQNRPATIYPLCTSGWCLARLRTTCSLWAFIRTCIVEKVWEEGAYVSPSAMVTPRSSINGIEKHEDTEPKAPAPRRPRMGIGAFWGTMQRGLSGGTKSEPDSPKGKSEDGDKRAAKSNPPPPPPPRDPARRLPPPLPAHSSTAAAVEKPAGPPPPLPQRNRVRDGQQSKAAGHDAAITEAVLPAESKVNGADDAPDNHKSTESKSTELDPSSVPISPPQQPPSSNRGESHDEMPTSSGEPTSSASPPPPTARPMSPSAIPLPASSPSTPLQAAFSVPGSSPISNIPPITAAALHDEKPPSRTGSPAPPPLPRRAAKRRPLSGAGAGLAAPPTPPPRARPPPAVKASEHVEPMQAGEKPEVGEKPVDSGAFAEAKGASPPAEEPIAVPTRHLVEEPEEQRSASTAPEAPVAVSAGPEEKREDQKELPKGASEPSTEEHLSDSPRALHAIDLKDEVPKDEHDLSREGETQKSAGADGPLDEAEQDIDPRYFVGDSTWEERTWKELVRLREEMFWARIGGVR